MESVTSNRSINRCRHAILGKRLNQPEVSARRSIAMLLGDIAVSETRELLLVMVRDPDTEVQIAAALGLAKRGDLLGVGVLASLIHHRYWSVRRTVAEALGESGMADALAPLLTMLTDSDVNVQSSAANALGKLGEPGANVALERAIQDNSHSELVRTSAVAALAKLGAPSDSTILVSMLQSAEGLTQYRGAYGLLRLGDHQGVEVLSKLTEDKSSRLRQLAAEALCTDYQVPEQVLLALARHTDPNLRVIAAGALGKSTASEAIPTLLDLSTDAQPSSIRQAAIRALASSDHPRAIQNLLSLSHDGDQEVRLAAIAALAGRSEPPIYTEVLEWVDDPEPRARRAAAQWFGDLGYPGAIGTLLELAKDQIVDVRVSALAAMAKFDDPRAFSAIIRAMSSNSWEEQFGAAVALDAMGQRAVDLLIEKIDQTGDEQQLAEEVWILDKVGDPAITRPVILERGSAAPAVWQRVAQEAVNAGDRSVMGALIVALNSAHTGIRMNAAEALGTLGDRNAVLPLTALLGDSDWQIRLTTLASLGRIGSSAIDLLETALSAGDKKVRAGVAELLGKLQGIDALAPLTRALGDPRRLVRANAATALGNRGDARAIGPLIQALHDADRGVRNSAAGALGRLGMPEGLAAVTEWTLARRQRESR